MTHNKELRFSISSGIPLLTLMPLLLFTFARFAKIPYVGFDFILSTREIDSVFIDVTASNDLKVGDQLIRINEVSMEDFSADPYQTVFADIQMGQSIQLEVERKGQQKNIQWIIPGLNRNEFIDRLLNVWFVGYIFWLVGTVAFYTIRPKDTRWWLFLGFNYLTAIWLVVGSIARWQIWDSAILFRSTIWLSVPIYLHLHWIFPSPFTPKPRLLLWFIYGGSILLVIAEWLLIIPKSAYWIGFLIAVVGSMVLLLLHFIRQKSQRFEVRLLFIISLFAVLPSIVLGIVTLLSGYPTQGGGSLLSIPILPIAYFYTIHRRRLGGLETRANRITTTYAFFILLGTGIFSVLPLLSNLSIIPQSLILISGCIALFASLFTAIAYPMFSRWFERHVLNIPLDKNHLIEIYSDRITTNLDSSNLAELISESILPSLTIRQSTLLHNTPNGVGIFISTGVEEAQIPNSSDFPVLQAYTGKHIPSLDKTRETFSWIRIIIPLRVNDKTIGLWLFGRKDPDDFYSQSEIALLETIANQTAIALINIEQAEYLHTLYQANIDRYEEERSALALELHDDVLSQLAMLATQSLSTDSAQYQNRYQQVMTHLRQMVSNLRPAMLHYGLSFALEECVDELLNQFGDRVSITLDISPSDSRFDPKVEKHLYRIVQQACENALRHAQAKTVRIHGSLEPEHIDLIIEDNGAGFEFEQLDLATLLANKHFGLAGMFERADLIDAKLKIDSTSGKGTTVSVIWCSAEKAVSHI